MMARRHRSEVNACTDPPNGKLHSWKLNFLNLASIFLTPYRNVSTSSTHPSLFAVLFHLLLSIAAAAVACLIYSTFIAQQRLQLIDNMSVLKTLIINPRSGVKPTATLFFLHGLGDSSAGWQDVAEMLSQRPSLSHVRFVLPNAPIQPVTLNMGMPMPSWFDSRSSYSCGFE